MNDVITPMERANLSKRYRLGGLGPKATIGYAIKTATEYADKHAAKAPPVIKNAIARVFIHFMLQPDAGEKRLLMTAVDRLIEIGKGAASHEKGN